MQLMLPIAVGLLLTLFAGAASACAICFSGTIITPGQKLDSATEAVLAFPSSGTAGFSVVAVVKGDTKLGALIPASDVSFPGKDIVMSLDGQIEGPQNKAMAAGKPLLLLRDQAVGEWTAVGAIGTEYADWLKKLAATKHDGAVQPARLWPSKVMAWSYLSDEEWRERVLAVGPQLESSDSLAAEIAYGEVMRAPYSAMRALKPQLDATRIRSWIADPDRASRRAVYTLLLGIAGTTDDAAHLEDLMAKAMEAGSVENLSAMLAADLELRGADRVDWLETVYFADRNRTLPEIDAALLALSVHGEADAAVPRSRIVEAYRHFIDIRKPMAGFVAMELANWQAWEATPDYVEIVRSKAVKDPAGQFAILSYLKSSPLTSARALDSVAQ